jgi:hypothetical protein
MWTAPERRRLATGLAERVPAKARLAWESRLVGGSPAPEPSFGLATIEPHLHFRLIREIIAKPAPLRQRLSQEELISWEGVF